MTWLADPHAWAALATLTAIEIILGIDNVIFIAILAGRLPAGQRDQARMLGLALAMVTRIGLLFCLSWLMSLSAPLVVILAHEISGRDLLLLGGGLFLLAKSTLEIHAALEGKEEDHTRATTAGFLGVLAQILLLDLVFSLDSVITAIGLVDQLSIMVTAIVIAVLIMMAASGAISRFIESHPTLKILALSFLLLIGMALVAEGFDLRVPKGYIYFAMAFSAFVEALNLRVRRWHRQPLALRRRRPAG